MLYWYLVCFLLGLGLAFPFIELHNVHVLSHFSSLLRSLYSAVHPFGISATPPFCILSPRRFSLSQTLLHQFFCGYDMGYYQKPCQSTGEQHPLLSLNPLIIHLQKAIKWIKHDFPLCPCWLLRITLPCFMYLERLLEDFLHQFLRD